MSRKTVNLFGLGFQSASPNVTAGRLVNAFYEFHKQDADRTKVSVHGTPGLDNIADAGASPWRGLLPLLGTTLYYGVAFNVFYEVDNAGNLTPRGTISTTSGRVGITTDGTNILVVDGTFGYTFDTSDPGTPIAVVTDPDFPDNPNTCTYQGGRFLVDSDNTDKWYASDPRDPTSWDGSFFASAESTPGPIVRILEHAGTVRIFKDQAIEMWQNVGGSGFPYSHVVGANVTYGLGARNSIAPFQGTLAFLSNDRSGQVTVSKLDGIEAIGISNPEFDREINSYATTADASGIGYSYQGHNFYQLNFPSAGKSWLYDGSTGYWSELSSGDARHRAEHGIDFLGGTVLADYSDGRLYNFNESNHQDDGETQIMLMRSRHLYLPGDTWFRLGRLELRGENGVGTRAEPNPVVCLRMSKDGGHVYGTRLFAPIGVDGDYHHRTVWRNLGRARDLVAEISVSANVKRIFTSAVIVESSGL